MGKFAWFTYGVLLTTLAAPSSPLMKLAGAVAGVIVTVCVLADMAAAFRGTKAVR